MCRHLAYLGPATTLGALLYQPPFGLVRQSWAPRRQRYGALNADGFGVGWYVEGEERPVRYRRACPMWQDDSFADVARVSRTGAALAAVRSATAGTAWDAAAAAPYRSGRWLFSHNGRVEGWPDSVAALAATLPPLALLELEARVDSALLFALVRHALGGGAPAAQAVAATVAAVDAQTTGRLNLLLTDGAQIVATAHGDTLCYRAGGGAVLVASEPGDDEPGWVEVPDRSLLVATTTTVEVTPLAAAATSFALTPTPTRTEIL